jgi:hypothetical protein
MIYDNEAVMFILGMVVVIFVTLNINQIKKIRDWQWLLISYYLLMAGWFFTILEGFILPNVINWIEHISYAMSALILAVWCRKMALSGKRKS